MNPGSGAAPTAGGRIRTTSAPLFTLRGLGLAIPFALVLCWPTVLTGHLSAFYDTAGYLSGGDTFWRILGQTLFPAGAGDSGGAGAGGTAGPGGVDVSVYSRSLTYSALFSAVVRTLGPVPMMLLQAFMVSLAVMAAIDRRALDRPVLLAAGLVLVVAFSPLAWMTVYLMPDVLGAIVLILSALLIDRIDGFNGAQKVAMTLLAAFAVSSHYGNMPVAFAAVGLALLLRLIASNRPSRRRARRAAVLAGLTVVATAPALNLAASSVALGTPSIMPLHPPVALARSLEDGPARWYLQGRCAEAAEDELCAGFDESVPDSGFDFLWGTERLTDRDAETVEAVRNNEWRIVVAAALEYPGQQLRATFQHTGRQLALVAESGTPARWTGEEIELLFDVTHPDWVRPAMRISVAASAMVLLLLLVTRRLDRSQTLMLAVILFGLMANAFVFGAVSVPADRYQARVAWLLPLMAALFIAERGFARRPG
ncbi:hypothetical protein HKCCE2091_19445 [Rhodobacterales bacterium HKCCE2091]|nr:hypothetical protein [Rhodobacterales bacterium HKCCE2091]